MALHRVVYAKTVDNMQAHYQRSYLDCLVDQWLEENCQGRYYHGPGWLMVKSIEFEDSKDAVMFALKWS
jgi:hypothetical protein